MSKHFSEENFETIQEMEKKIADLLTQAIGLAKIYKHPRLISTITGLIKSHNNIGKLMIELEKDQ